MSLILEALKKSEQQRRLGEAPNLATPIALTRRRHSLLPMLALTIVAALGVGWWLSRTPPPAAPATRSATASAAGQPATPRAAPAAATPAAAPAAATPPPSRKIGGAVSVTPPPADAVAPVAAPVLPATRPDDRPGSVTLPAALPATPPVVAGTGPMHEQPAPPGPASPLEQPAAPAVAATPPGAPTPAATPPAAAPASATSATAPAYPSVWELPWAVRKDLPPLRVTMHVYAPTAAERFVVVNGERHVEGDEVADGVTLGQIRADGMVLQFKGHSFTFPRDGR